MVTREEMLDALTIERFGTGGVLGKKASQDDREWQRLKELAEATKKAAQ